MEISVRDGIEVGSGQLLDLYAPRAGPADGSVLLWHGSGPRQRSVMRTLATKIAERGLSVFVPDWSSDAEDGGASDLLRSYDFVVAERSTERLVLAGWSAGAKAAMALALGADEARQPRSVVAIAGRYGVRGRLGEASALQMAARPHAPVTIRLAHGLDDDGVPVEESRNLFEALSSSSPPADLTLVAADHAGVIGCIYDPEQDLCIPTEDPSVAKAVDRVASLFQPLS